MQKMRLPDLPPDLLQGNGSPTMRSESKDSKLSRLAHVRGHVCDMEHLDVRDCDDDTPLDKAIRQGRMFNFYRGE